MDSSRAKSFLGVLAIISFLVSISALVLLSDRIAKDPPFYSTICLSAISFFNAAILFGWIVFGKYGGIPLTIIPLVISLWLILKADFYECMAFMLSFIATTIVGYSHVLAKNSMLQSYNLNSEKLSEETNMLSASIIKTRASVIALEDKLKRYAALKEVAEVFSTDLSLETINNLITEKAIAVLGKFGRMLLFLVDMKKEELELSASRHVSKIKTKKGDVFDHWVLRHRRSLVIEDITKDFRFSADDVEEAKACFRSLIETPLISESKVIGILRMDSEKDGYYDHDDLWLLDIISDLGAVAMQNAMLYARTQELAIKDGLTGLSVRRYFMERFQEELRRTARKKGEISLLIMDIDHFKEYNDKYGHAAGDIVLKHLARTISAAVREGDIAARYGGEEMALVFFGCDKAKAVKEADAIRRKIESLPITLRRQKVSITVSIGVANYPKDASLEQELIKIADERLYRAKTMGRNRICAE